MAGARAFMDGWTRLLEELGSTGDLLAVIPVDDESGLLTGAIQLAGGRRLDVYLRLRMKDSPELQTYSLQLMDSDGRCIVRYDNANHYRELPGAPHHVHVRDKIAPVMPEPSLRTMLAAIKDALEG